MILEFSEHNYIDMDKVEALRWIDMNGQQAGVIVLKGQKVVVTEREDFDVIEAAFIYQHKSYMYDDKLKKIRFSKRELQEGE
jgi:hypothetical protein